MISRAFPGNRVLTPGDTSIGREKYPLAILISPPAVFCI